MTKEGTVINAGVSPLDTWRTLAGGRDSCGAQSGTEVIPRLVELADIRAGSALLDVGCGVGALGWAHVAPPRRQGACQAVRPALAGLRRPRGTFERTMTAGHTVARLGAL